jgi:hypothetical protein
MPIASSQERAIGMGGISHWDIFLILYCKRYFSYLPAEFPLARRQFFSFPFSTKAYLPLTAVLAKYFAVLYYIDITSYLSIEVGFPTYFPLSSTLMEIIFSTAINLLTLLVIFCCGRRFFAHFSNIFRFIFGYLSLIFR